MSLKRSSQPYVNNSNLHCCHLVIISEHSLEKEPVCIVYSMFKYRILISYLKKKHGIKALSLFLKIFTCVVLFEQGKQSSYKNFSAENKQREGNKKQYNCSLK